MVNGKRIANEVQAAEKWYVDLRFEVRNKGGHSSRPVPDNAIYHLAGALVRLSQFGFPLKTSEVTRIDQLYLSVRGEMRQLLDHLGLAA